MPYNIVQEGVSLPAIIAQLPRIPERPGEGGKWILVVDLRAPLLGVSEVLLADFAEPEPEPAHFVEFRKLVVKKTGVSLRVQLQSCASPDLRLHCCNQLKAGISIGQVKCRPGNHKLVLTVWCSLHLFCCSCDLPELWKIYHKSTCTYHELDQCDNCAAGYRSRPDQAHLWRKGRKCRRHHKQNGDGSEGQEVAYVPGLQLF